MSKKIKSSMLVDDAALCAFYGWKLSYDFITLGDPIIFRQLGKFTKKTHALYKQAGIKLSLSEISWLIFCCAMLREKLYKDLNYEMLSFMIDDESNKVRVAFEKH
jgi:hypothetical protein